MTDTLPLKGRVRSIPLRVKLVAAVLALVTAALVVISLATAYFLHNYLIGQIDSDLRVLAKTVQTKPPAGTSKYVPLPTDYLAVTVDPNSGQVVGLGYDNTRFSGQDLPAWPDKPDEFAERFGQAPVTVSARSGNARWRIMYVQLSDGNFALIGEQLSDIDQAVKQLLWIDVLVGGGVLILLASVGAGIVRTSLRPLVDIERTAAAIAGGDLTRRIPDPEPDVPEPTSELGRLSRALNTMLSQIEAAFTARAASETAARHAESAARDAAVAAQASESRARRSEERMRQFIADASHELRTPLTSIRGFAELYRQGAVTTPEDSARLLRRIEDEASRMGLLVEDLLLLARLDRERPLELAPVELPVLAADTVQAAQAVAPDREIALEVEPGSGQLLVLGDDARLRQVLTNLMTNALSHTPPEAGITVRLRAETGNLAVVEVADTGPGLSAEQAERVFERFYRADSARTRRSGGNGNQGTGLGLAIVAALVAAHHGTVEVRETPGGGATFRVRLPRLPDSGPDDEALS
ncbi:cell wall metabolism sensor histidine kinase WalK [Plantactinospora sp. KBS50]|uniref:sensor histidine kinase n=1 Tax=Plantactinospora sp. KBS50 TaxID=2024580 RepID=UPI000BAAB0DF|nr:HAMP domain-containing sensor histidine kinase [Plantactinospora sp. KBS50]ASW56551.1 two-component sensor histidine kinase [Plantactinospora sp. KBS50]